MLPHLAIAGLAHAVVPALKAHRLLVSGQIIVFRRRRRQDLPDMTLPTGGTKELGRR